MLIQIEFDVQQALDNGSILRGLSHPMDEYPADFWRNCCEIKAKELELPLPSGYLSAHQWVHRLASFLNNLDFIRADSAFHENQPMLWHWVYHWMLSESEQRLLSEV